MISTLVLGAVFFLATGDACPQHGAHVDARHDTFGMSHDTSHHSFRLFADGGAIELRANDPKDDATTAVIRTHLHHIAGAFAKRDFSAPMFVHGHPPDGIDTMKRLHKRISYRYEDVVSGGRIRITTADPRALEAVHDFMRFQVVEHRSGDSGQVEEDK